MLGGPWYSSVYERATTHPLAAWRRWERARQLYHSVEGMGVHYLGAEICACT